MCHPVDVDITDEIIAAVPQRNLCIPVAEFAPLWARAEHRHDNIPFDADPYLTGVVRTCRWLYSHPVPNHRDQPEVPAAPFTQREHKAMPETIDLEYMKALGFHERYAPLATARARGVAATLGWACHGTGQAPLDMAGEEAATG